MSHAEPKSFEEWLEVAPVEEIAKGLYDRVGVLQKEVESLKQEIQHLKENRNFLLTLLQSHTHNSQGGTVFPSTLVNFND